MAEIVIKKLSDITAFKLFLKDVGTAHPSPLDIAKQMWDEVNEHHPKVGHFPVVVCWLGLSNRQWSRDI